MRVGGTNASNLGKQMTSHDDLHRDIGRMEGKQDAMGARLDKLEKMVSEGFQKLDERLARIEDRESQRKGAFQLGHWLVGTIAGLVAFVASHFLK